MTDKNKKDLTDPVDPTDPAEASTPVDPADPTAPGADDDLVILDEDTDPGEADALADDADAEGADAAVDTDADDEIPVETIDADDDLLTDADVPYELREDRPDPGSEPKTGLVSEFRDLTGRQAAWLVSNRETVSVSRSPLFYVTSLILGLAVIAAIIIGAQNASPEAAAGDSTLATVGLGEQAAAAEQQLGLKIKDVDSVEEAQELVRTGEADAALIVDPSGMGQEQLVALNSKPTEIMNQLQPEIEVTYLEEPPVPATASSVLVWGMAMLLLASVLTLGAALYANARVEKRNRLAEVIAATIPPKAAAWGRVYGLTVLALVYLVITVGVLMLGLSIASFNSLAMAALPGIGWFSAIFLIVVLLYMSLFLWAATPAGRRARQISCGLIVLLAAAGAFVPMVFALKADILRIMSYVPFTAPVAMPMRYFAGRAEWWEGLLAAGIALVVALIAFALAAGAYEKNLLRGAGHGGRTVKPRKKGAAAEAEKKSAAAGDSADAEDADAEAGKTGDADATEETSGGSPAAKTATKAKPAAKKPAVKKSTDEKPAAKKSGSKKKP
ncbi:ABC transporter permease [Brevibacterium sp. p3-SID960]|uniref:ABC transporter permease n=1 Tax=Brevibacterium sp. p3-SID960 TaxID=2916063 RepID=UPI0021A2E7F5|nr:ABC transporter permease [Brevibacterium sp. p3-SID960]MCT1690710.1 ABC transporter permease [Brevibacterium sp. p3-SID960]